MEKLVQLAKLAIDGDRRQIEAYVRRLSKMIGKDDPEAGKAMADLVIAAGPGRATRAAAESATAGLRLVPVDQESRWDLLRVEAAPYVAAPPILPAELQRQIEQIIAERRRIGELLSADLEPSRTILFTGAPGVGKTLSARWIAQRLGKPLFTLDLATVMSSLLGKTGSNIKAVLEYAKANDGVLLLDEFDAVAKRRNDDSEVGELKRLVTVILQEIDLWPSDRLLVAATNHGELLDPAVWRRFDAVIAFPLPEVAQLQDLLQQELNEQVSSAWARSLAVLFAGHSFSDVVRSLRSVRREAILNDAPIEEKLRDLVGREIQALSKAALKNLSVELEAAGIPQRRISEMTGLSRDTIRRARHQEDVSDG